VKDVSLAILPVSGLTKMFPSSREAAGAHQGRVQSEQQELEN
jgi:hypothetical protein